MTRWARWWVGDRERRTGPDPAFLGWTWDVSLSLWHNPDWDIRFALQSARPLVSSDSSPGSGLDPAIRRTGRHQSIPGRVCTGTAGGADHRAGAGTEDPGAVLAARAHVLDSAEIGS